MTRTAVGQVDGAVEVFPGNEAWPRAAGLDLSAAPRTTTRGDALLTWLRAHAPSPSSDPCFYLAGHTASISRLRTALLAAGRARRSVRTKAYWADGKRGL